LKAENEVGMEVSTQCKAGNAVGVEISCNYQVGHDVWRNILRILSYAPELYLLFISSIPQVSTTS
jgi:hypothetical protein